MRITRPRGLARRRVVGATSAGGTALAATRAFIVTLSAPRAAITREWTGAVMVRAFAGSRASNGWKSA